MKFVNDGQVQCLPIDDILELKNNPPKHKRDLDTKKIYTTLLWNEESEEEEVVGIQIAEFACKYIKFILKTCFFFLDAYYLLI